MTEITALQLDNQSRQEVVSSGHPPREQLQEDKKLLVFYTGILHFTILLALFEFVIKAYGHFVIKALSTMEHSGFLKQLRRGDVILADRGFNVGECLGSVGASLHISSFTRGKSQLSPLEVAVRQRYSIMSATGVLSKELFQHKGEGNVVILDAVVTVCCGLNNLCEGIIPFE